MENCASYFFTITKWGFEFYFGHLFKQNKIIK